MTSDAISSRNGRNLTTQVPRGPDRGAGGGNTIHLWAADEKESAKAVLGDLRRAAADLLRRRAVEVAAAKAKHPLHCSDAFGDPPYKPAAAASDREKLGAFAARLDRIDAALLKLDGACELFEAEDEVWG